MKTKVLGTRLVTGYQFYSAIKQEYEPPCVGWSSIGTVSTEEARKFAQSIIEVCDLIDNGEWEE
tara:strand:- start:1475 stop:1666 length:192 start_codon:yes stop_codon:yes gene_type:complete